MSVVTDVTATKSPVRRYGNTLGFDSYRDRFGYGPRRDIDTPHEGVILVGDVDALFVG